MTSMRVALLYNLNRGQADKELEFDYPSTIEAIESALSCNHHVKLIECTRRISMWVAELEQFSPDIALNLAEGFSGPARESFFPNILDQMEIPYIGNNTTTMVFGQNKALCKQLASIVGVRTPPWALISETSEIDVAVDRLAFPLFVKPNTEGSSLGIDGDAKVYNHDQLSRRVERVLQSFGTSALVEEFISNGTDISLSFIEGLGEEVFGPVKYAIGDAEIYDFAWKKRSCAFPSLVVPHDLPSGDVRNHLFAGFWAILKALNVRGYARADYRVSRDGTPYFLEINPQVEMAEKAEFAVPDCSRRLQISGHNLTSS